MAQRIQFLSLFYLFSVFVFIGSLCDSLVLWAQLAYAVGQFNSSSALHSDSNRSRI